MIKQLETERVIAAIIMLAKHIERCPFNENKVEQEILDILEFDKVPHSSE